MPGGNGLVVVIVSVSGAAPIINCNVLVAVWGVGGVSSVTVKVWLRLLVPVGIPPISPVDVSSANPVGRAGDPTANPHV